MAGYLAPVDAWISCSWQCHKDRNPPSSEPGTDYACAYGTPIRAAAAGTVTDVKTTTSSATGRYLTISLDDGNTIRYLHLSSLVMGRGARVDRGTVVAYSGASGFGSEWGYGAHVHTTLWLGPAWATPTVDFTLYVGNPDPPAPDPIKEDSHMLVFQVNTWDGGGIQGTCFALAPGTLYVCRDAADATSLASTNNPTGQLLPITDENLTREFDARGIPRELMTAPAGTNWAWSKEAATSTSETRTFWILAGLAVVEILATLEAIYLLVT